MSFYTEPSFFIFLGPALAGAALLGLCERTLKPYSMVVSLVFLACLFAGEPRAFVVFSLFVLISTLMSRWLLAKHTSKLRFACALCLTLAPLVVSKVGAIFEVNLLGFIGVSYITFKALQVLFEVRDGIVSEMPLFDYLYYLLFFPVFTSGPIDRSRRFLRDAQRVYTRDEYAGMLARGLLLLGLGLVYTFVIATFIQRSYTLSGWGSGSFLSEFAKQIQTMYGYGFYLFFDFAGYSLMAMGLSYCFGIQTPRNFRAPFISLDIKDFWNRWNITLSFWLRDFVFMRFSRFALKKHLFHSRLVTACWAFIFNMVLMGAWHGLTANYLLYGLYHGLLLAGTEIFQKKSKWYREHKKTRGFKVLSWFVTLQLVMLGFALFSGQVFVLLKGVLP